jgi:hypothetical protein
MDWSTGIVKSSKEELDATLQKKTFDNKHM